MYACTDYTRDAPTTADTTSCILTALLSSKLKEQLLYLPRKSRSLTNLQRVGSLRILHATQAGHRLGQKPQLTWSVPYSMLGHPVSSQRGYLARRLTGETGLEIGSALPRTYTVFCTPGDGRAAHVCGTRCTHACGRVRVNTAETA